VAQYSRTSFVEFSSFILSSPAAEQLAYGFRIW
jgi:hypothetical protein